MQHRKTNGKSETFLQRFQNNRYNGKFCRSKDTRSEPENGKVFALKLYLTVFNFLRRTTAGIQVFHFEELTARCAEFKFSQLSVA